MSQIRTDSIVPSGGVPAGASGGGIIQTVTVESTSNGSTTSGTFTDFPGLSATITPRSTSNKVLVTVCMVVQHEDNFSAMTRLLRGASKIFPNGVGTESYGFAIRHAGGLYGQAPVTLIYLDSPATTSATTYKIQFNTTNASIPTYYNKSIFIDTASNGTTNVSGGYVSSTITLTEISG